LIAFFYFSFDLESGLIKTELSWGILPILAAILALICSILVWKKNSWKWGITGISVAILAAIYMLIVLNYFSYVTLPYQKEPSQSNLESQENKILGLILSSQAV
jgi:riboflavin transporter FmnP